MVQGGSQWLGRNITESEARWVFAQSATLKEFSPNTTSCQEDTTSEKEKSYYSVVNVTMIWKKSSIDVND
jgi:hypothetical protein